jgi:hypothetical protein
VIRSHLRLASVVGAIALSGVATAPALAATNLSSAGANALTISVAGNENGSGNVTATNDGSGEKKTGDSNPTIGVLSGAQDLFRGGALAQEATASASHGTGASAACAGLAGAGGSVVRIGDSKCLSSGSAAAKISIANLSLDGTSLVNPDSAIGAADNPALAPLTDALKGAINQAIAGVPAQLADLGLSANADAISAHCRATPGTATGDSDFENVNLTVAVPGQDPITVASLNQHYPPNTDVFVNLSAVVTVILKSVEDDLTTSLTGALAPLASGLAQAREAIVTNVTSQLDGKLAPLSENALKLTLNKQSGSEDQIRVNALDLQVLPAAKAQLGASALAVQIGNVVCGPSGRQVAPQAAAPAPKAAPKLPTAVSAGYGDMPAKYATEDNGHTDDVILAAFAVLVATAAGAVTFRRLRR